MSEITIVKVEFDFDSDFYINRQGNCLYIAHFIHRGYSSALHKRN